MHLFFILSSILLCLSRIAGEALSYRLVPYEKTCFYETIANSTASKFYFYFAIQDQQQKIDVSVLTPSNNILHSVSGESFGDITLTPPVPGDYSFCFSNMMSFTSKVVDFDISIVDNEDSNNDGSKKLESPIGAGLGGRTISDFEASLSRLSVDLRHLQNYQRYFRIRDARNQSTVEATQAYIFWFSFFEVLLIIGMAGLQVHILRQFFTTSHKTRV